MLDFTMGGIISGMLLSGVGFILFRWGKNEGRMGMVLAGVVAFVAPLAHPIILTWGIAAAGVGVGYWVDRWIGF